MPADQRIQFHYLVDPFYFPARKELKVFLSKQLAKEGKKIDHINFIFCSDAYLLKINQDYLQHNSLTDIITFELSEKGQPLLADIYISLDRVKENAQKFQVTQTTELHRVLFHGILHLCGYKDKSDKEVRLMRKMEEAWMSRWNVSRGTKR